MDKPSSSGLPRKPSTRRRVRLIPATPRPEGKAIPTSRSPEIPIFGTSQPPETSAGNLYSRIIREAMANLNHDDIKKGRTSSSESSSKAPTLSGIRSDPTSSSSLRFSNGETFEEVATEVIREMREIEEKEEEKETRDMGEQLQAPAGVVNREPQKNPVREVYNLTGIDDMEAATTDDWRSRMEETVSTLVVARAEQNAMLRSQGEQLARVITLVDRVISWIGKESQASHQLSPAGSTASQNKHPQNIPDINLAETSKKRKPTTDHPPSALPATSAAKRTRLTRHSGSQWSQREH